MLRIGTMLSTLVSAQKFKLVIQYIIIPQKNELIHKNRLLGRISSPNFQVYLLVTFFFLNLTEFYTPSLAPHPQPPAASLFIFY